MRSPHTWCGKEIATMQGRTSRQARRVADAVFRASLVLAVLALVGLATPRAEGAKPPGAITATPTPNLTLSLANYSIGQFQAKKETITGYTITFPSDTDVSAATAANVGDTITRNVGARSVTITLGTPIVGGNAGTNFFALVNDVRNPSVQGLTYTLTVRLAIQGGGSRTSTSAAYAIITSPYLSFTITTPDTAQVVNFGNVDPGAVSPPASVTMDVVASNPYTIVRTISANGPLIGLTVVGGGEITGAKPAGADSFTDTLTVNPPWTTDPAAYAPTIVYTVTLQ